MRNTRHHLRLFAGLTFLVALLAVPDVASAHKLPPGVHVDPGSPAAKEYSIPLSTARGVPAGSANQGQLFGAGITKDNDSGDGGSSSGSATTTSTGSSTAGAKPGAGAPAHHHAGKAKPSATASVINAGAAATAVPPALKVLHPGSGSGVLWMVLVGVLVLVVGLAGGFAISRTRGRGVDPRLG
jgi:hypothetical protein